MPRNVVGGMLRGGLYTRVVGRRILYFQRLTSTMDEATRQAQKGAEDGTVVLAEEQTAGRGRFERAWVSAAGNIHLSIILRPTLQGLPYLSIVSGVAVARAIRKTTGLKPTIKWPNDVRLSGKKVCGILVENALQGNTVEYAVVGIGVNVSLEPSTVDELANIATSLNVETGKDVDREDLLRRLLQEMDGLYLPMRPPSGPSRTGITGRVHGGTDGPDTSRQHSDRVIAEWRSLLETLGQPVEVRWQDEVHTGYAEDVDGLGNLMLRLGDGTLTTIPAGEVFQTRAVTSKEETGDRR